MLSVEHLSCGHRGHVLLKDVCFSVEPGEIVCLLGPNGIGKSTLFRTIQGFLPIIAGRVTLDGVDLDRFSRRELAGHIAYVPQTQGQPFPYTVYDMILMGRASFVKSFSSPSREDHAICAEVIRWLSLDSLQDKLFTQISGGEQRLVLIARAMAQRPRIMMMDEPTSNLDFGNQVRVLQQIVRLSSNRIGVLMITHSPDQALICADKAVLLRRDKTVLVGKPQDVLTERALMEAYGVRIRFASVEGDDGTRLKTCIPLVHLERE